MDPKNRWFCLLIIDDGSGETDSLTILPVSVFSSSIPTNMQIHQAAEEAYPEEMAVPYIDEDVLGYRRYGASQIEKMMKEPNRGI